MLLRKAAGTCNVALMIKLVVGQTSEGELSTASSHACSRLLAWWKSSPAWHGTPAWCLALGLCRMWKSSTMTCTPTSHLQACNCLCTMSHLLYQSQVIVYAIKQRHVATCGLGSKRRAVKWDFELRSLGPLLPCRQDASHTARSVALAPCPDVRELLPCKCGNE
jgi:hypothetical protein